MKANDMIDWNMMDDLGQVHHLAIKKSSYFPDLPYALLSPNIGANKKTTIFVINIAPKWSNWQTIASCTGVSEHSGELSH